MNNNLRSLCSLFKYQVVEIAFNKFSHEDYEVEKGSIVYFDNNPYCLFDNFMKCSDRDVDTFYEAIAIRLNSYKSEYDEYEEVSMMVVDILSVDRERYFEKTKKHLNQNIKSSDLFSKPLENKLEIEEIEEVI